MSRPPWCQFEDGTEFLELTNGKAANSEPQEGVSPLLTAYQVADYLGVGENVVRQLFRTGKLRAFKVGGQWRTRSEDVMDYTLKQLQKSR